MDIAFWHNKMFATGMTVPKTAVNKYNGFEFAQNYIGFSWQSFYV
jgi:hypothetical protein